MKVFYFLKFGIDIGLQKCYKNQRSSVQISAHTIIYFPSVLLVQIPEDPSKPHFSQIYLMEGNDKAQAELRGHYGNNVTDDITMARLQVILSSSAMILSLNSQITQIIEYAIALH